MPFFFFFFFIRETTSLENRILHDRGGCSRSCGGETGASPPTCGLGFSSTSVHQKVGRSRHKRSGGGGGRVHCIEGEKRKDDIHVVE